MRQMLLLIVDLGLVFCATIGAFLLWGNLEFSFERLAPLAPYTAATLVLSLAILPTIGANRAVWRFSAVTDYLKILAATALVVGGAVAFAFSFNRLEGVPRSLPILQAMLIPFALIGVRMIRRVSRSVGERRTEEPHLPHAAPGYNNVLVIGLGGVTNLYLRAASQYARHRVRIAGLVSEDPRLVGHVVSGKKILGLLADLSSLLRDLEIHGVVINRIVVAEPFDKMSEPGREALREIESSSNIQVEFLLDQLGLAPQSASEAAGDAVEEAFRFDAEGRQQLVNRPYWRFRRALDIIGAMTLLILLAPIMPILAVLIAVDVGAPVTFWQQRPGLNGRPFRLTKFRTMIPAHDEEGERVPDEQRSSPIGRFLRLTRLDELPQLANILTGEMSFIGPRPLLPIDQPAEYAARLLIRPGLTGWAQVIGGREISAVDKAALDVWYVRNASLVLDMEIVVRTIQMVIVGERIDHGAIRRAWDDLHREGVCAPSDASPADAPQAAPFADRQKTKAAV